MKWTPETAAVELAEIHRRAGEILSWTPEQAASLTLPQLRALVRQQDTFDPLLLKAISAFVADGGHIIAETS